MTDKEIKIWRSQVEKLIDSRRLIQAMPMLQEMARKLGNWSISERVENVRQAYACMLTYMAKGAEDPERQQIYDKIVLALYAMLDSLEEDLRITTTSGLYFSTLRTNRITKQAGNAHSISDLVKDYQNVAENNSLFAILTSAPDEASDKDTLKKIEDVQKNLFNAIWTKPQLTADDQNAISLVLESNWAKEDVKTHIVSALLMGQLQRDDERKTELLLDVCLSPNTQPKAYAAAFTALLINLWKYSNRPLSPRIEHKLLALKDSPKWNSDLRAACIELIRAYDTERINKKMQEEVIPSMLDLKPEIMDKINGGKIDPNDMASLQENPEWQELLDKNGITDKLKEITEIQMEGGDVLMSTFRNLKGFPFFNDISNWFLPFSTSHSMVREQAKEMGAVAEMMETSGIFCDSDKYSFFFALEVAPAQQKRFMSSQFQGQSEAIYQAMSDMAGMAEDGARGMAIRQYLQNIYRFFKLFKRKDEFFDPFEKGINLISTKALSGDFTDAQLVEVIAEFYFKHGYMAEALETFHHLETLDNEGASSLSARYQKMGYAYEKLGERSKALEYYRKAELLDSRSQWTLRRMAACYRVEGNKEKAREYYSRLADNNPEDTSAALLLGYVFLEMDEPKQALKQFYKVEFLDEKSTKALRPLAWTLFLTGDFDSAEKYYNKVKEDHPTPSDWLNMGHVALAKSRFKEAIDNYQLSVKARKDGVEGFLKAYESDLPYLEKAGVDSSILPLIADAVIS